MGFEVIVVTMKLWKRNLTSLSFYFFINKTVIIVTNTLPFLTFELYFNLIVNPRDWSSNQNCLPFDFATGTPRFFYGLVMLKKTFLRLPSGCQLTILKSMNIFNTISYVILLMLYLKLF